MQRRHGRPEAQGLYDPAHEHDACGVGFVAKIDGTRSHALVHQGIEVLERLEHRGACGCDPETGDGAGILLQLPDRFLRQEAPKLGIELPAPGAYASGMIFLAQEAETRAWQEQCFERLVGRERPALPRLARRAREPGSHRLALARRDAGDPAGLRRRRRRSRPRRLRAQALRDPPALRERGAREGRLLLRAEPVEPHLRLHRHADVDADRAVLPGSHRSGAWSRRSRSSTRATAPTPSRPGISPSRSATWRTTARSTRCAATATRCARAKARCARRSSATTSRGSIRS